MKNKYGKGLMNIINLELQKNRCSLCGKPFSGYDVKFRMFVPHLLKPGDYGIIHNDTWSDMMFESSVYDLKSRKRMLSKLSTKMNVTRRKLLKMQDVSPFSTFVRAVIGFTCKCGGWKHVETTYGYHDSIDAHSGTYCILTTSPYRGR